MTDKKELQKWFPGLYRRDVAGSKSGTKPKLRVLCFPPAGCAEDLFSTEGTGARRAKSPLLEWARKNDAEILSTQYPGRANRSNEPFAKSCGDLVRQLFPILSDYCQDGVPYVIIAHSVGTWIAYELLQVIRKGIEAKSGRNKKLEMPEHVYLSSFLPPSAPEEERPWNVNKLLSEEQFIAEVRRWNVNEIVFQDMLWKTYHPLLRADFCLFDEYEHTHDGKRCFSWDLTVFSAKEDDIITQEMCEGWKEFTTGKFNLVIIDGHHLFPLQKEVKPTWLKAIADGLDSILEYIELKEVYCM